MLFNEDEDLNTSFQIFKGEKAEPREFKAHKERIYDVKFNMDGTMIATGSGDAKVMVWDTTNSYAKMNTLKEHKELVERTCWNPAQKNILASVSED